MRTVSFVGRERRRVVSVIRWPRFSRGINDSPSLLSV